MELLSVENVSKSYSSHHALSGVSLSVPKGSIFGLLGPNGAGKTTLIRIITKIIQQDSGEVYLNGRAIDVAQVRKIGYLPEERGLYKKMKVGEQLIYLARLKGLSRAEAVSRIKYWLDKLGLTSWHNKAIEDLSKGMAQKIQFIATVVHQPDLIILDEPFSGFDPVNADLIKDEILKLKENGATIIFSTHRMESVEELCDHLALINKSEKILDGKKSEVKDAYRDGSYQVSHIGQLVETEVIEILEESKASDRGLLHTRVKDRLNTGPNALLGHLLQQVEIHGFSEIVPSINDIFIEKVGHKASSDTI